MPVDPGTGIKFLNQLVIEYLFDIAIIYLLNMS